jgi:periplasmic protein CpxP/Spy
MPEEDTMTFVRILAAAVISVALAFSAAAQQPESGAQQDELQRLAEAIGLSDDQQSEIRAVVDEIGPDIQALQTRAQLLQQELQKHVRPDYDEDEIREGAERLGDLTGEMTALSVLMQARIQAIFTEEQREQLQEIVARQQQQQQQFEEQMRQQQID